MRIAMIGQKGIPARGGGIERHVHDLSIRLVQAGHSVLVYGRAWYTGQQKKSISVEGVESILLPSVHTKHLDTLTHTLFATFDALKRNVDVIHYHGVGPSIWAIIPRMLCPRIRVVTTFHSIDRHHQKWGRFARLCLRIAEWTACRTPHVTITVSQSLAYYCQKTYRTHTTYIPNGTYMAAAVPQETVISTLLSFGLVRQEYVVMISRLVPHKGAHILLEAFLAIKRVYPHDATVQSLRLAIVGGSVYTDEYVALLRTMAQGRNDIVFTGEQTGEALEVLYRNAAVLVHPSLNEGLPMTVLEAMGRRTPVLVSDIAEHRELVHEAQALFPANSIEALADALYAFLYLSDKEKQMLVSAHEQLVHSAYSWDVLTPQIVAVYRGE